MNGGTRGVHARCADSAHTAQAEYDAKQARIDAGELFVLAAWGDWQAGVPEGMAASSLAAVTVRRGASCPPATITRGSFPDCRIIRKRSRGRNIRRRTIPVNG